MKILRCYESIGFEFLELLQGILLWEILAPTPRGNLALLLQPLEEIGLWVTFWNDIDSSHLYTFELCGAFFLTCLSCSAVLSCANYLITFNYSAPNFSLPPDPHLRVPQAKLGLPRDVGCLGLGFGLDFIIVLEAWWETMGSMLKTKGRMFWFLRGLVPLLY